jgi:hypothetical protein
MADEAKPEDKLKDSTASLVDAARASINTSNTMTREERAEACDVERFDLYRREVEQFLRIREEAHKAYLEELAHVRSHRNTMEVIAQENAKSVASIAESLQVIAKAVVESA